MTAETFLKKLATDGGAIISSNDLSPEEIETARREDRFFVDEDGLGYVYEPID
jgi:hypothetical protein